MSIKTKLNKYTQDFHRSLQINLSYPISFPLAVQPFSKTSPFKNSSYFSQQNRKLNHFIIPNSVTLNKRILPGSQKQTEAVTITSFIMISFDGYFKKLVFLIFINSKVSLSLILLIWKNTEFKCLKSVCEGFLSLISLLNYSCSYMSKLRWKIQKVGINGCGNLKKEQKIHCSIMKAKSQIREGPTICRGFTILLTMVIMGAALAGIGVVSYSWIKTKDVWQDLGTAGIIIFSILLSVLGILFFSTLFGCCGAITRNRCCLITYVTLMTVWMAIFVAIGVCSLVLIPKYFNKSDDSLCTSISIFSSIQSSAQQAQNSICYNCPCYFPNSVNTTVYSPEEITRLRESARLASLTNSSLPVKVQGCVEISGIQSIYTSLFAQVEKTFKCTGWCTNTYSLFYKYTDVNAGNRSQIFVGKPELTCYLRLSDKFNHYGVIAGIVAFVIAGVILGGWVSAVTYLCNSGKKGKPQFNRVEKPQSGQQQPTPQFYHVNPSAAQITGYQ